MSKLRVLTEVLNGVAWITLNNAAAHNAFDKALIAELTVDFEDLGSYPEVRVIVLRGLGKSFSAGADIEWMKQQGAASLEANQDDARRLARLFHAIDICPKPTVACVQGAAIGGGVGLVAACDIAIGSEEAVFALSEVRLGLIPATIAPYVVRTIGERHARRLFQTGERINAATAQRIGLLHEVASADDLNDRVIAVIEQLLRGAPEAQTAAKTLVQTVAHRSIDADLLETTALLIAERRAHPEAAEGLGAFLEKRPAAWVPQT